MSEFLDDTTDLLRRTPDVLRALLEGLDESWTDTPDSTRKVTDLTNHAIDIVRKSVGPDKKIIYTFWSADLNGHDD